MESTPERRAGRDVGTATLLNPDHPSWPPSWRQMNDPPPAVHVTGEATLLQCSAIAMVGTRRATPRGLALARGFAADLAARGWLVVSGLALGIDAAAHRGALEVGGRTCAIMATGADRTYPGAHRSLRTRIEGSGCCVTEFDPGTTPYKSNFRQRNRLIAGLAAAVIVIEAPHKSGALITANRALDYDREVFAVPGPVDLDSNRGCHRLLREGAHLMESVVDVVRVLGEPEFPVEMGGAPTPVPAEPVAGSSARWILDRLDLQGVRRDELRERWPGNEAAWLEGLTALELAGLVSRLPGGRLARRIWTG